MDAIFKASDGVFIERPNKVAKQVASIIENTGTASGYRYVIMYGFADKIKNICENDFNAHIAELVEKAKKELEDDIFNLKETKESWNKYIDEIQMTKESNFIITKRNSIITDLKYDRDYILNTYNAINRQFPFEFLKTLGILEGNYLTKTNDIKKSLQEFNKSWDSSSKNDKRFNAFIEDTIQQNSHTFKDFCDCCKENSDLKKRDIYGNKDFGKNGK